MLARSGQIFLLVKVLRMIRATSLVRGYTW